MALPQTKYAKSPDGLHVAYQVHGEEPTDIVMPPPVGCVDVMWGDPIFAHVLKRLARFGRVISLDFRGLGVSDPVPLGALPTPEQWIDDIGLVLDDVGSPAATLISWGNFTVTSMFAATYPERTNALVLVDPSARMLYADDHPIGVPAESLDMMVNLFEDFWGTEAMAMYDVPERASDEEFRQWYARAARLMGSPAAMAAYLRFVWSLDLRSILPAIHVPTLVLHGQTGRLTSIDHGRYIAEHIPDAQLVLYSGGGNPFLSENTDELLDHIEEFVTGIPAVSEPDRALATVVFTDIVGSTELATSHGDKRWTEILDRHDAIVDRELHRHRGRKVNPTGDGMVATFDGPARAVRCAMAICRSVRQLGIEVRAGVHTGEIELRGDDIGGIAVHIGARVSSLAGPGEVFVSRTVTDLVAGSEIAFEERGEHALKGVTGKWAIYSVVGGLPA